MHLFLAVDAALEGDANSADEHLQLAFVREKNDYDQQLQALARLLVRFERTPAEDRRREFRVGVVRSELGPRLSPIRLLFAYRDVRRVFRSAGEVLHRGGASPWVRLWFRWSSHWQWTALPVAPFAVLGLSRWGLDLLTVLGLVFLGRVVLSRFRNRG